MNTAKLVTWASFSSKMARRTAFYKSLCRLS